MGHVTWPRPFQGRFVICRLGLAMFKPRLKFEMSTITCNEEMKGTPNVKILVLSHLLGDLEVTHRVHLWLEGMRVVNFLLAIIEFFSLALTTVALLSEICRNRRLLTWVGHFERTFQGEGGCPPTNFGVRKQESLGYHVVLFA